MWATESVTPHPVCLATCSPSAPTASPSSLCLLNAHFCSTTVIPTSNELLPNLWRELAGYRLKGSDPQPRTPRKALGGSRLRILYREAALRAARTPRPQPTPQSCPRSRAHSSSSQPRPCSMETACPTRPRLPNNRRGHQLVTVYQAFH